MINKVSKKLVDQYNNVTIFLKGFKRPSIDINNITSNKTAIILVMTLVLLNVFGVTIVSNLYLLGYLMNSYIEHMTKHNNDSDLLIMFGCFYSIQMLIESILFKFIELKFELLVIKLFFYGWAFHPDCNGYIIIYNYARHYLNITEKKTKINENILTALEQLENNQSIQTNKLQQVFKFYEKLNEDLDKYERFNDSLFNEYKVNADDLNSVNSNDSLYVHPPSDMGIKDDISDPSIKSDK